MSSPELVIVVADALRLRAIRLAAHFHGRVLYFSDSNLASAFESIRAHEPGVVALEGHFAHSDQGRALSGRLKELAIPGLDVQLVTFANGAWSTSGVMPSKTALPLVKAVAVEAPAPAQAINTRRVPRFPLANPQAVKIEGTPSNLVDLSVMGAQVLSTPPLRPNQKLRVVLPDEGGSLAVTAAVAWSFYELAGNSPQPHYRAGMEFTDAALPAIEDFCKRHCAGNPLPLRF